MAENKTKQTGASVAKFLASIKDETRRKDGLVVSAMMKKVTGLRPAMWGPSIVGFGRYHYTYESGREGDMPLVGFSPRKDAMTLYLMCDFPGKDGLMKRLGKHKGGKACLYIKSLEDVDKSVLEKIVAGTLAAMKKKYGASA